MAVMMVAGNSTGIPSSIFKGVRTLTTNIAIEMGYAQDLHREALIATGVVLFVFILIINISCSLLKGGTGIEQYKYSDSKAEIKAIQKQASFNFIADSGNIVLGINSDYTLFYNHITY